MASLVLVTGPDKGKITPVREQPISIGRAEENTIPLDDVAVSFLHARIRHEEGVYLLEDLSSSNGTYVNNKPIDCHELTTSDTIRIGLREFVFYESGADAQRRPIVETYDDRFLIDRDSDSEVLIEWVDDILPESQMLHQRGQNTALAEPSRAGLLVEVGRQLGQMLQIENLLQETLRILCDTFEAERGFVQLFEDQGGQLAGKSVAVYPVRRTGQTQVSRTLIDQVLEERRPILSYDATRDRRFSASESIADQEIRAVMVAPLMRGAQLLGVVQLDSKGQQGVFGREELELLSVICEEVSVAIENAQLFKGVADYNASILECLAEGLIVVDREERVTTVNREAERLLGLPSASILGHLLGLEQWLKPLAIEIQLAFEGDEAQLRREVSLNPPGREPILVECSTSLLTDKEARSGAVMLLLDLSERRRLAQATERSERLASMGRAVSGLTRRMQEPLASIEETLEELAGRVKSRRHLRELVEQAMNGVSQASQLAQELRGSIENTELVISEVAIERLIDVALQDFQAELTERGVRLEKRFGPVGVVKVDPDKLTQIVTHLVSNALDAIQDGGTLTVATGSTSGPSHAERVWVEVGDNGEGISADVLPHIFDAFYSHQKEGTGLGLYISHELVKQLGGEIQVTSRPNKDTRFHVSFPRRCESQRSH